MNITEWLVSTPAVRLFLGSALSISFGLACRAGVTNVVSAGTRSPARTKKGARGPVLKIILA